MMGNFLTTLGIRARRGPRDVRGARAERRPPGGQRGATRAPTTARGWLEGDAPGRSPIDEYIDSQAEAPILGSRHAAAPAQARAGPPATRRAPSKSQGEPIAPAAEPQKAPRMSDVEARLEQLASGASTGGCGWSRAPRARACCSTARRVLLLCSNNYLGFADHPQVREAARDAAMRYGVGRGRVAAGLGQHDAAPAPGGAAGATFEGTERCVLFGSGYLANAGVVSALARQGRRSSSPTPSTTRASSTAAGSRGPRRSSTTISTPTTSSGACASRRAAASLIVTDGVFSMDGDVAPLAEIVELADRYGARADGRRGARAQASSVPAGAAASQRPASRGEVDVIVGTLGKALGGYGAYACCDADDGTLPREHRPHPDLLDRAAPAVGRRGASGAGAAARSSPA